jgi:anaerobic dimethyl sulfoxide reductase subunit C (anchor subunit)
MAGREWPLVVFTLLGQLAVGCFFSVVLPLHFARPAAGQAARALRFWAPAALAVILAAGAAVSFLHLGHPFRAYRVLANLRTSWLSREIVAELAFLAGLATLAALAFFGPGEGRASRVAAILTSVAALAFLASMTRLYMLTTVPNWNTAATPLSFGLSAGLLGALGAAGVAVFVLRDAAAARPWVGAALGLIGIAVLMWLVVAPVYGSAGPRDTPALFPPAARSWPLHGARLGLLAAAGIALASLVAGRGGLMVPFAAAALAVAAAEVVGRFLFYGLHGGPGR